MKRDDYLELYGQYLVAIHKVSDINQHIVTLQHYATECNTIIECGVRSCVSTWGFLYGLVHSLSDEPKKLIHVDMEFHGNIMDVERLCKKFKIHYEFHQINDLDFVMQETDLLFIDTWHIYGHLKRELEKMHSFVRKYIIMHDTEVDGELGESIRCGHDILKKSQETGIPENEIRLGLKPAVKEFLETHPEFRLKDHYTHNNGLTILERISP